MREQHRSDWVEVELGEIAKWGSGGTPKSKFKDYYNGDIPWLIIGDLNDGLITESEKTITQKGLSNSSAKIVEPGNVLIAMYGSIGKLGINKIPVATNQAIAFTKELRPFVFNKYLFLYLLNNRSALHNLGRGGTQKNISQAILKKFSFPLPPLPEQRAIVAKLEQLFSELDQGIASLQTARKQLDTYRQAVLKQAFEGELTRAWREQQTNLPSAEALLDQIQEARAAHHAQQMAAWEAQVAAWEANGKVGKKPRKPGKMKRVSNESAEEQKIKYLIQDIPDEWAWVKVASVGEVQLGRQRSPKHHNGTHMRPYLRVANVFENRIDLSDVLEMNFSPEEFQTYELKDGDILLNEGQSLELVGRPAMYRGELPGACFQNTLVRFRPYSTLDRKFALHLMLTYFKLGEFQKIASWTTSIAHLGAGRFAELFVPIPSLPEQHQIVAEIESRLSVCDKLAETIEAGLQQAEALRQSLLKKAFEGRLLSEAELAACRQEPDWEPAEALLARIRAEKEQTTA